MENNDNRHASRQTILIDDDLYTEAKRKAIRCRLKLYEFINNVLAKAVGMKLLHSPKHPTTKKRRKTQK